MGSLGIANGAQMTPEEAAEMAADRAAHLDLILNSTSARRVIVAGPGSGKTYTFRKIVEQTAGEILILSFLGNLVADLDKALGTMATVRTLHRFSRGLLHHMSVDGITHDVDYYPSFRMLLEDDVAIYRGVDLPKDRVEEALRNLDDADGVIADALTVGNYYNAVGHTDAVFRVVRHLDVHPSHVPAYAQVLVDEFQDFNQLEIALIRHLASESPVAIVGDDDQALYAFKDASPEYLRDLHAEEDYESFELPYCTRCTSVLVDSTHTVVHAARQIGLLNGRIDKEYICFLPEKEKSSTANPQIVHAHCSVQRNDAPYMSKYIAKELATSISPADVENSRAEGFPTALIVAPKYLGEPIHRYLIENGFPWARCATTTPLNYTLLDGYERLLEDGSSRLGWRIVLGAEAPVGWQKWVRTALEDSAEIVDCIPAEIVDLHLRRVDLLRRLIGGDSLTVDEESALVSTLGVEIAELPLRFGVPSDAHVDNDTTETDEAVGELDAPEGQPTIAVTSMLGAKGLQAEHVFVVGFMEGHFPRDNGSVTDGEVCTLLVALTRARQRCTLVSAGVYGKKTTKSVFLDWLKPHLENRYVDKTYLS